MSVSPRPNCSSPAGADDGNWPGSWARTRITGISPFCTNATVRQRSKEHATENTTRRSPWCCWLAKITLSTDWPTDDLHREKAIITLTFNSPRRAYLFTQMVLPRQQHHIRTIGWLFLALARSPYVNCWVGPEERKQQSSIIFISFLPDPKQVARARRR